MDRVRVGSGFGEGGFRGQQERERERKVRDGNSPHAPNYLCVVDLQCAASGVDIASVQTVFCAGRRFYAVKCITPPGGKKRGRMVVKENTGFIHFSNAQLKCARPVRSLG